MLEEIERLRDVLRELALQYGNRDPRVIRQSQLLDELIVQYMKSLPGLKSKPRIDTSIGNPQRRIEYFNRLQSEIEQLEKSRLSSDPIVTRKTCELSSLLLDFIRIHIKL